MCEYENLKQCIKNYKKLEERVKLFYYNFCGFYNHAMHTSYTSFCIDETMVSINYDICCLGSAEPTSLDVPIDIFVSSTPLDDYKKYLDDRAKLEEDERISQQKAKEERKRTEEYDLYLSLKSKFGN